MPTASIADFTNTRLDPVINPDDAMASILPVKLKASTTFLSGTVVGEITASPGTYGPYDPTASDGTEVPAGILRYGAVTDSASKITNIDEWGGLGLSASMYTRGDFLVTELAGLDANAVDLLQGRYIPGPGNTIIFHFS